MKNVPVIRPEERVAPVGVLNLGLTLPSILKSIPSEAMQSIILGTEYILANKLQAESVFDNESSSCLPQVFTKR